MDKTEFNSPGAPHFHEVCLREPHQVLPLKVGEKSPPASGGVLGEVAIVSPRTSVLPQGLPSGEILAPQPDPLREGNAHCSPFAFLVPTKGG